MSDDIYKTELLQDHTEFNAYLDLIKKENITSYLEIGSANGGSIWRTADVLEKGAKIVSLSLGPSRHLRACIENLVERGFDARLFQMDSLQESTVAIIKELSPFDCIFIDACHTLPAVTSDWNNYGPMGRIIAFHDIGWNSTWKSKKPGQVSQPMGCPDLWNSIKDSYRHNEIKLRTNQNYYGIGVLWRY